MHEHVDVFPGDAELLGDVLARSFFEKAKRDDRALNAAQLGDTRAQANDVLEEGKEAARHVGVTTEKRLRELAGI